MLPLKLLCIDSIPYKRRPATRKYN